MMETKEEKDLPNNEIIVKSIVYGSIAFWLGKKADETVSHKWVVYVRGLNNEDISYFIKEVVFTLHASFENHVRVVNKYPFELYEAGWGEFDIKITINFIDESIKQIEFIHPLKLYPQANISMSTKKPIVSENYEEVIFVNPKPYLRELLTNPLAFKKEHSVQIQMNIDDDKRSVDHSFLSQSDEKFNKSVSEKQPKRDPPYRLSTNFEKKFDKMNLGSQIDVASSIHGTTFSIQQKVDDMNLSNTLGNYKFSNTLIGDIDNMNINPEMQIDYPTPHPNLPIDSESYEIEKKFEEKKSNYIPNIQQYFLPIDDSSTHKLLEDANKFVIQEIQRLKKSLQESDKEITNIKRNIRELTSKLA